MAETPNSELDAFIAAQQSQDTMNLLGPPSGLTKVPVEKEAALTGNTDLLKKAFSVFNTGVDLAQVAERKAIAPDPEFNVQNHLDELSEGLSQEDLLQFSTVASLEEARALKADLLKDRHDAEIIAHAGARGITAALLSGIVDVDLPIVFFSGGTSLGSKIGATLAKLEKANRAGKAASYGVKAAEANVISSTGHVLASPSGDWSDVPAAAFDGMLFGAAIGSLSPTKAKANAAIDSARMDFHEDKAAGLAGRVDYEAPVTPAHEVFTGGMSPSNDPALKAGNVMFEHLLPQEGSTFRRALETERLKSQTAPEQVLDTSPEITADSIGAASTGVRQEGFEPSLADSTTIAMRTQAEEFLQSVGLEKRLEQAFPDTIAGRAAKKFQEAVDKTPFMTDYNALMQSDSKIAQALAYSTLESSSGIARNNRSSAMMQDIYKSEIENPVNGFYNTHLTEWIKDNVDATPNVNIKPRFIGDSIEIPGVNIELGNITPKRMHPMLRKLALENREAFNRQVMTELQYRLHEGRSMPNVHPSVKAMADRIDDGSEAALKVLKGLSTETPVRGAENIQPRKGWFKQRVKGSKINQIIGESPNSKATMKALERTLAANYRKLYPTWTQEHANIYAKAVISNARGKETGIDINAKTFLDNDGRASIEQFLRNGGAKDADIEAIIQGLTAKREDAGRIGSLKERADLDLRTPIEGTTYTLMDIVDVDIPVVWTKYAREVAGASALARQNIQRHDIAGIIDSILKEQAAHPSSTAKQLTREQLEGIFSYFSGGPVAGGVDPAVRRITAVTRLSLLNQLGLTQLLEVGAQIGAVGFETFIKTAPKEFADVLKGRASPVMEELRPYLAQITGEHMLHLNHLNIDEVRQGAGKLGQGLDRLLAMGSKLQGYTSLFFKVNQIEQRAAISGMLYKLAQHFKGIKKVNPERLYDIGLGDAKLQAKFGKYFNDTVTFDETGQLLNLNLHKWAEEDVYELAASLNRHVNQVVQRAQFGEGSVWMHKSVGSLFTELKNFTLTSIQKQTLRNLRIADTESLGTALHGIITAGIVYAGQQAVNGNDKNLNPEAVIKGAIANSNTTGWMASTSDIITGLFGAESLKFRSYGAAGRSAEVFGSPSADTLNRLIQIPPSVAKLAAGSGTSQDIYALKATPILGNMLGISGILNEIREDLKEEARTKKKAEN